MTGGGFVEKLRRAGVALESPILMREMRTLLRGRKFFASQMLLLLVLAGVLLVAATASAVGQGSTSDTSALGKVLFWSFAFGLGVAVIFLVPAFSCTGLTTERETKALDLLLTTTIQPWEVVWGKLLSSLVVIALFMASALPLVTVCFLFGGISPWDLALLYLLVLFCTLVVSSMSLAVSAHCQESKSSVVISYVLTLVFLGLLCVAALWLTSSLAPRRGAGAFTAVFSGYHWTVQFTAIAAMMFLGLSIFAINFAAAANRLKPPTANRSTNLRAIWLVFLLGCLGLFLAGLAVGLSQGSVAGGGAGNLSSILATGLVAAVVLVWLGALYFASEEARLSPRLMEDIARTRGLRLPLRAFLPGPANGLAFALLCTAAFLGCVALTSAYAADAGANGEAGSFAKGALSAALFILTSAGLAALGSGLGLRHRAAGLAAGGASLLLGLGPLIHLACMETISPTASVSTLWNLHYLSPIIAGRSAWEDGGAAWEQVRVAGAAVPLWKVSALAYLGLAAATWGVALIFLRRLRARWQRELAAAPAVEAAPAPAAPNPEKG